jgi:hypothetical protein
MAEPTLINNGWLSVPWAHYIGGGSGSDGTDAALGHGPAGNQATFPILVNWDDVNQAIVELCGEYFFSSGPDHYLTRILPKQHPMWPMLYVSRVVSVKPMKWTGKDFTLASRFSDYRYAMLSLLFQQPKYPLLTDQALDAKFPPVAIGGTNYRQEWYRYCEPTPKVGIETLSTEAGAWKFAEGTGGTQPTAGSTLVTAPTLQPLSKGPLLYLWRNVPYYGLFSPTTGRPEKLIAAAGTVNSVAFPGANGYPVGTLRFDSYDFVFNEAPYPASRFLAGLAAEDQPPNTYRPSLTVDVTLAWTFFDPPHSHSASRGHNLAPYRGDPDGSWYLITSPDGAAGSAKICPSSDHRKIFSHADL